VLGSGICLLYFFVSLWKRVALNAQIRRGVVIHRILARFRNFSDTVSVADSLKRVLVDLFRVTMRRGSRSGGFDVASAKAVATHVDSPPTVPKFRTIISIQPEEPPTRRSPVTVLCLSPSPSNGREATTDGAPGEADPDETGSVASSASSNGRTPWNNGRPNGHVRSPSSASSSASQASYRHRTPGSYVSPTSPRRETADVDEQRRQLEDHPFFAMFRDAPYEESQIVSGRGTVRGVRNRVKSGIAVFVEKHDTSGQKVRTGTESVIKMHISEKLPCNFGCVFQIWPL